MRTLPIPRALLLVCLSTAAILLSGCTGGVPDEAKDALQGLPGSAGDGDGPEADEDGVTAPAWGTDDKWAVRLVDVPRTARTGEKVYFTINVTSQEWAHRTAWAGGGVYIMITTKSVTDPSMAEYPAVFEGSGSSWAVPDQGAKEMVMSPFPQESYVRARLAFDASDDPSPKSGEWWSEEHVVQVSDAAQAEDPEATTGSAV